ncbi:MAG: hypothetical protein QXH67_06360 [Candidatus Bathyarchaeia archaeon]|nr:hypothetical protein [Candidatus Bathyarchaeota archaeon]
MSYMSMRGPNRRVRRKLWIRMLRRRLQAELKRSRSRPGESVEQAGELFKGFEKAVEAEAYNEVRGLLRSL